jgi:putative spermidine/putrescine transport system substrate-binding protein
MKSTSGYLAIAALISVTTAASAEDFSGREAVVWSPGGAYTTALQNYVDAFEKSTGGKIRLVEASQEAAMAGAAAQVKAGNVEWDGLSSIDEYLMPRMIEEGVLAKVDPKGIEGVDALPKAAVNDHGIAVLNSVISVSYRSDDNVTPLTSVADFFNPDIKGSRTLSSAASQAPLICILALSSRGVSMEELSAGIDTEHCFRIIDEIKDQVSVYWTTGSQMAQLQIDEEVDYCLCWDGRVIQAAQANPSWKLVYDGGVQMFTYFVVVRGSENIDMMKAFIKEMMDPQLQAKFTELVGYSAPLPASADFLPDNLKPFVSVSNAAQAVLKSMPEALHQTVNAQSEEIGEAWQTYLSQ